MTRFSVRRAWAMALKEVAHVSRDPFTMMIALGLPLIVVFIFGIAIEFNLNSIPLAVVDQDKSMGSLAVSESMASSGYFKLTPAQHPGEGIWSIQGDRVRGVMVIPPGFEKSLITNQGAKVQIMIDGSDGSVVASILSYLTRIQSRVIERILNLELLSPIAIKTRFLFNPELNSRWFIVPGLTVVILAILSVLLTALTIAREWENGSMEQLLATPVRPLEIMIGKLSPYALLGLVSVAIVYILARTFFEVPFVGSHLVFLLGSGLFLVTCLAQGLLISIITRKQTLAMQIAILSGLLPTQLLSGFIFPIESMPLFFRYLTTILPARWFMVIARDCFLRGSDLWDLRQPFIALAIMALIFVGLSLARFRRDLEL